jgi:hypothetical protein
LEISLLLCQVARKQGEYLPVIAFGTIKLLETYQDELEVRFGKRDVPVNPGCFALSAPYEGFVLIIHDQCPARYVNDAKDRPDVTKNVQFHQHPDPRSLYYEPEKGFQLFLQLQATRDIAANEELCCAYGTNFWEPALGNLKGIDEKLEKPTPREKQLEKEAEQEAKKQEEEEKKQEQEEAQKIEEEKKREEEETKLEKEKKKGKGSKKKKAPSKSDDESKST